jgi:glyoxylase-like metal-dependent hydrolase (beta-lactamase superfamily II)
MSLSITEPAPGVYRLSSVYTNWYLVEQGGRVTVLDGGLPGDWAAFSSGLRHLGLSSSDIDAVLITHHHPDHVGNAERLRSAGARVFAHSADLPFLRGERHLSRKAHLPFLAHPWYLAYVTRLLVKGITRVPAIAQLESMADGEVLDVPGAPRVVHCPGHTAGSCALLIEDQSVLFSGDALVTSDVTFGWRKGPQVIRGPVTEDAELALESLETLSQTNAEIVLPGHGEPWTTGVESAVAIALQT